jgi:hypothetical protein
MLRVWIFSRTDLLRIRNKREDARSYEVLREHIVTRNISIRSHLAGVTGFERVCVARLVVAIANQT